LILNVELSNKRIREVRDFTLSSKKLEETIKTYPYTGENRIKDPVVENTQFPPIIRTFYSYVYEYNAVPSPDVLVDLYLSQECFTEVSADHYFVSYESTNTAVSKEGLIARILRTYPSLIRDLHFYLMAVESGLFQSVWYSVNDDFTKGIDIRVKYNNKWYNIALLQSTTRSLFFKNKKKNRHPGMNADLIYVELNQAHSKRCGDYNLYTLYNVEQLKQELEKK
jgi:hypothetical protein